MSEISQTLAGKTGWIRFAAATGLALAIGLAAFGPYGSGVFDAMARTIARAEPHAFDAVLFAGLPLAIKLHILGAVGALVLGAVLMTQKKGRLFHRVGGWTWVALASLVAGSSIFIREMNHGSWSVLHVFTAWTLISLPAAVAFAKRHQIAGHRRAMMGLFYGAFAINMLVAFIPGRTMWNLFF